MDVILKLLKSSLNEEKIAGVILSVKLLNLKVHPNGTSSQSSKPSTTSAINLQQIVVSAGPSFIIRMLYSANIYPVAMAILQDVEQFPKVLSLFTPYVQDTYDILLRQPEEVSRHCTISCIAAPLCLCP